MQVCMFNRVQMKYDQAKRPNGVVLLSSCPSSAFPPVWSVFYAIYQRCLCDNKTPARACFLLLYCSIPRAGLKSLDNRLRNELSNIGKLQGKQGERGYNDIHLWFYYHASTKCYSMLNTLLTFKFILNLRDIIV